MAWLTRPYVASRTGPTNGNRLHPEALDKDWLLWALSLRETDPKSRSLYYKMVHQSLELVHTDICGLMPERSLGGSRYFIRFIDDCTRKVWAYLIRLKFEALEVFTRWLVEVENWLGYEVKTLWSDNGGEYTFWSLQTILFQQRDLAPKDRSLHSHVE